MDIEQKKKILAYYDPKGEYKPNKAYSSQGQIVFTKEHDKEHWLVMEDKGSHAVEVRQTDSHGKILSWDAYESRQNAVKCTGVERLAEDEQHTVVFHTNELNLIANLGKEEKSKLLEALEIIAESLEDKQMKQGMNHTKRKIERLSPSSCSSLVFVTRNRKTAERKNSIYYKLEKAKEQIKEREKSKTEERGKGQAL